MEDLLKTYIRDRKIETTALRAAVGTIQPAQSLRLLLAIRNDSYSAIMVAAEEGHTKACHLLLSPIRKTADELLLMKRKDGRTVLHIAVWRGDCECVELLVDTVSDERKYEFVAEKTEKGNAAIGEAAWWGRNKCIECILYSFSSLQRDSLLNIQD
ncbi:putative ankyrin repeat protein RF_0922 [Watersipora subatra]|uniref:putative ankyrin repeat protein RF_0922 n=1 Tax=Watersipora subatra TaxID=2589382 RepID=UPI00355B8163